MMHSLRKLRLVLILSAAAAAIPAAARAQDAAELLLRIDRLENLVRQLNGQVEQAQNQNRRLEEQLRRFQSDTDFRFKEMEGGRAPRQAPAAPQPGATQPAAPQPGAQPPRPQRGDAFDPAANPQAAGAPQPLGSPASAAPPRRPAGGDVVATPGQIIAGQDNALGRDPRDPQSIAPPARGDQTASAPPVTPQGVIELGRRQLRDGQYDAAEQTFRDFTRSRPRDRLIPDALMGLGDSFFQRQRWREAAEQFVDVTTKFPKSGRAPEAELKLAISLRSLGAAKEACDVLTNHGAKYPSAPQGTRQGVQRELQRARCGA
jgi:tol-pal system protein YbgF